MPSFLLLPKIYGEFVYAICSGNSEEYIKLRISVIRVKRNTHITLDIHMNIYTHISIHTFTLKGIFH